MGVHYGGTKAPAGDAQRRVRLFARRARWCFELRLLRVSWPERNEPLTPSCRDTLARLDEAWIWPFWPFWPSPGPPKAPKSLKVR